MKAWKPFEVVIEEKINSPFTLACVNIDCLLLDIMMGTYHD